MGMQGLIMSKKTLHIHVPTLARVEGEGALDLMIKEDKIEYARLHIYEPPRLFERFLQKRASSEVVDIVARICGICPVAYQMSASAALEQIYQIKLSPWIRDMRRLFYCGEWLESHNLHVHLLAVPDFLGFKSAPEMAKQYPAEVRRGLMLQHMGNEIVAFFGGRSVHPVGARIGGFYHAPSKAKAKELLGKLKKNLPQAKALVYWTARLPLPQQQYHFTCVAMHHDDEYAIADGRIISNEGLDISKDDYEDYFKEMQVPHSTALHCHVNGNPYLVGPLARVNLNHKQLPQEVQDVMNDLDITWPSYNMFHSVVARAIETYYAFLEAIRILENYVVTDHPAIIKEPQAGVGYGATEAPRGLLWHRYEMDDNGLITQARIVPPTSQNQARVEMDLRQSLKSYGLDHTDEELTVFCESVVRNYDPCISCSTHFLDLRIKRT
jgi:sulfhydrogenase subunit alpha